MPFINADFEKFCLKIPVRRMYAKKMKTKYILIERVKQ